MATKTFEELKQLAIQIRDEKTNKQNTATRVGTAMLEHINKLEQDYYDKTTINNRTSEYNVSINHPTSGISSSNKYDLSSAIAQVPAELRTAGLKVSFLNSSGKPESWKYQGGSWAVANFIQESSGGNKILTWVTDAATTRKQVSANERKAGMQISYKPDNEDWVNEQYIGTSFTDTEWAKDTNWEQIPNQNQITELTDYVLKEYPKLEGLDSNSNELGDANLLEVVTNVFAAESWAVKLMNKEGSEIKSFYVADGVQIGSVKTLCKYNIDLSEYPEAKSFKVNSYKADTYGDTLYAKTIYRVGPGTSYEALSKALNVKETVYKLQQYFEDYTSENDKKLDELEYVINYYPELKDNDGNYVTGGTANEDSAVILYGKNVYRIKANLFTFALSNYALALRDKDFSVIEDYTFSEIGIKKEDGSYDIDFIVENEECMYISMWSYKRETTNYIQLIGRVDGNSFSDEQNYNTVVNLLSSVYIESANSYYGKDFRPYRNGNDIFNTNLVKWILTPEDLFNIESDILYLYYDGIKKNQYSHYVKISDGTTEKTISVTENYAVKYIMIDLSTFDKSKNISFELRTVGNFEEGKNVTGVCLSETPVNSASKIVKGEKLKGLYGKDKWYWNSKEYTLQDAVNYTREYGTLYIPEGTYYIEDKVVVEKPISIIGIGDVKLYGGYAYKSADNYQSIKDVYQVPVNQEGYGWRDYDGDTWIYQDGIPDESTKIEDVYVHPIYGKRTHRLPMTRIWKTSDIQKVTTEQEDGKLYYMIDGNTLIFRAVTDSNLSENPVYLAKASNDAYKHSNEQLFIITTISNNVFMENIEIRYGVLAIMGGDNHKLIGVKAFGASQGTAFQFGKNRLRNFLMKNCESGGNQEDGLNGGATSPITNDISTGEFEATIEQCYFHDCQGDGISEHGKGVYHVKNTLCEFNGISGATPCGGDSVYINCIFRRNGDGQRAGLWVLPSDSDNVSVTAIGCCSYDNKGADYGVQNDSIHVNNSKVILSLYNCSSLCTEDTEDYALSASATTNHKSTLALYNFVTNRRNKLKKKGDVNIVQAPVVVEVE